MKLGGVVALEIEARYMVALGTDVCPVVHGWWDGGYAMELLQSAAHVPHILGAARWILKDRVWRRLLPPSMHQVSWIAMFEDRFGFLPPQQVLGHGDFCMVHGDPTAANMLLRGPRCVIGDPVPPGRPGIPPIPEIDDAKFLQSMMGWEMLIAGIETEYDSPLRDLDEDYLERVVFWCAVHMLRIWQRNRVDDKRVADWAEWCAVYLMELLPWAGARLLDKRR